MRPLSPISNLKGKRRIALFAAVLFFCVGLAAFAETPAAPADSATVGVTSGSTGQAELKNAVSLADLFDQIDQTNRELASLLSDNSFEKPQLQDSDSLKQQTERSLARIRERAAQGYLTLDEIGQSQADYQRIQQSLDASNTQVGQRISSLQQAIAQVAAEKKKWSDTLAAYQQAGYSGPPIKAVQDLLDRIDQAATELNSKIDPLISLQETLAAQRTIILDYLQTTKDIQAGLTRRMWQSDRPIFFSEPFFKNAANLEYADLAKQWRDFYAEGSAYLHSNFSRIVLEFLALLILWIWLRTFSRRVAASAESIPNASELTALFDHSFCVALLLAFLPLPLLHPDAPLLLRGLYSLILVFPVSILLIALMSERRLKLFVLGMAASYLAGMLRYFLAVAPPLDRLTLVLQVSIGIASILAFVRPHLLVEQYGDGRFKTWARWVFVARRLVLALLVLTLLGQIFGFNRASSFFGEGTFRTIYISLFVFATYRLLRSLAAYSFFTPMAARIKTVREHVLKIIAWWWKWLALASVALWIGLTASVWGLYTPLKTGLAWVWNLGVSVGSNHLTVGNVLSALVAIYVSVLISRLFTHLLDAEVYPRRQVSEGLGSAVNQGLRYLLIFTGLVVALSLLGFRLQNLAIVAGALGVGIGFGLQNIVNNFVSGLIMLVERPIKIGDVLELDDTWGYVRRIGIRATVIETFDNAELIVPNGDLLWTRLTNWTHSTGRNRVNIAIGVAYGSEVGQVMEILKQVALDHPEVLNRPEPAVLFMGFGDSSLDFEVRAYLPSMDVRLRVCSELRVNIYNALAENDITIPFPQRDVWIKSIEDKLDLGGNKAEASGHKESAEGGDNVGTNSEKDGKR